MDTKKDAESIIDILRRTDKHWLSFGTHNGSYIIVFKDGAEETFCNADELEAIMKERGIE